VEQPTFLKALGSIAGRSILDVACGTGMYSRLLKQRGAARVVAVDIAPEMIAVAKGIEERTRLGVEYLTYDIAEMPALGSFDVVTAVYLLHYAQSKEHLGRLCRGIAQNLKPGGRFVTVVANPEFNPAGPNYAKYGFTFSQRVDAKEGSSVALVFLVEPPVMIHYQYWTRATYEGALAEAGFRTIVWERLQPSPEAETQFGREFWEDYLRNPQAHLIHCEK
jgi:SAM-dependent methyltransferase